MRSDPHSERRRQTEGTEIMERFAPQSDKFRNGTTRFMLPGYRPGYPRIPRYRPGDILYPRVPPQNPCHLSTKEFQNHIRVIQKKPSWRHPDEADFRVTARRWIRIPPSQCYVIFNNNSEEKKRKKRMGLWKKQFDVQTSPLGLLRRKPYIFRVGTYTGIVN